MAESYDIYDIDMDRDSEEDGLYCSQKGTQRLENESESESESENDDEGDYGIDNEFSWKIIHEEGEHQLKGNHKKLSKAKNF